MILQQSCWCCHVHVCAALLSCEQTPISFGCVDLKRIFLRIKWLLPLVVLKATRLLKAAGDGWWWLELSFPLASPMPFQSPLPSFSKRLR